jgi:tetratricopeptide (TPR) repeat protein
VRSSITIVCLILALGVPGVLAEDAPSSRELRQAAQLTHKGQKQLEAGGLDKARQFFEKALTATPDYPDALIGLGHVAMRERRFDDALECFESAESGYAKMSHALLSAERENYERAQQQLVGLRSQQAALEQSSTGTADQSNQNRIALMHVEREILRLEAIHPPNEAPVTQVPASVHFFVGNALMNLSRDEEALEAWETCVREDPSFSLVYNNLAVAYWKAGRLDEARAALTKAEELGVQVNPEFKAALAGADSSTENR